jgi:hypothetical protein
MELETCCRKDSGARFTIKSAMFSLPVSSSNLFIAGHDFHANSQWKKYWKKNPASVCTP